METKEQRFLANKGRFLFKGEYNRLFKFILSLFLRIINNELNKELYLCILTIFNEY